MRFLPAFVATGILLAGGATLWAIEAQAGILKISDGVLLEYKTATWTGKRGPAGPIFGSDDPIPHTVLKELTLIRRVARIRLDVSCMYDPWFERVHSSRFKFTVLNSRAATLIGSFSDAAGSYVAEWLIVDEIPVRTLLSNDPTIVRQKLQLGSHR